MATLSITPQEIVSGLVYPSYYWPAGTTITYSIPDGGTFWASNYGSTEPTTAYSEFSAAQAAQFVTAIEIWDSYIANSMVQVDDDATYGQIRVAFTDIADPNSAAAAYNPPFEGNASSDRDGDIWIDTSRTGSTFAVGTQDFQLLLHVAGHALGLKHPFEAPTLPSQYDNRAYTVMSSTPADERLAFSVDGGGMSYVRTQTFDKTPMVLDIAAIQSRYGADTQTGAGATVYAFTDADLEARQAIYDASGNDTIDISALSRGSTLDLRPGSYSDLAFYSKDAQIADTKALFPGFEAFIESTYNQAGLTVYEWTRNVGIAFSTVIENAVGSAFADTIIGNAAANTIAGGGGSDTISGLEGVDTLRGEAANDTLDGGAGADRLYGGAGNDTYIVDAAGDLVREDTLAGVDDGGIDLVKASVTHTLKAFVENLTLTGAAAINGTGNALANTLSGNDAANRLLGLDGIDKLYGFGGSDTLDGGTGADRMYGGAGNDTYIVDAAGDLVREDTVAGVDDGGTDLVKAGVTHTLKAFVENLTLTGAAAINGTGNALANTITGNDAANRLWGRDGNDKLNGLGGNDVLRGGAGNDTLTGGAGADTMDGEDGSDTYNVEAGDIVRDTGASGIDLVIASSSFKLRTGDGIENLRLATTATSGDLTGNDLGNLVTAYAGDNVLTGLGGNDTIRAGAGNDTLRGGLGADRLHGEAGADTFVFRAGESLAATGANGADTIHDFATGSDHIDLAIFNGSAPAALYAEVNVASDSFAALKSAAEAAMTGSQRAVFVAGATNGWLFWSTNGADGTVEEAVQLAGRNSLAGFDRGDLI